MDNNNLDDNYTIHDKAKKYCLFLYVLLLICYYVSMIALLVEISKSNNISALNEFLIIASMVIMPIVLFICIYPVYALAHLCQKAEKIERKQEEIEMLLAKIVVDNNSKIKNEKEEK